MVKEVVINTIMRPLVVVIILLIGIILSDNAFAQLKKVKSIKIVKWGYIESGKILEKMPTYKEAEKEAKILLAKYKKKFKEKRDSLYTAKNTYQSIRLSLPLEKRAIQEKQLQDAEVNLESYKNQIFGLEGEYVNKRNELMEVPLSKLFKAADEVANDMNINIFFDRDQNTEYIMYINQDHDYSDYVLEKLGLGDGIDVIK